jgi:predicted site-specific integrase-resolvase
MNSNQRQIVHEIEWIKNKIEELRPLLFKRPSVIKQIRDLERQIAERRYSLIFTIYDKERDDV